MTGATNHPTMNDLGYTPPKDEKSDVPMPTSPGDKPGKPQYPSIRFNGEQAELAGLTKCMIGEEYEITIRIKATKLGGDSWERGNQDKPGAEFDVIAADKPNEIESSEPETDDDEEEETVVRPKSRTLSPRSAGIIKNQDEED